MGQDDGQWVRPTKDYAGLRYSQLAEITTANVKNLRPVWTFSTAVLRGHEEPPIVANNTMYILTPFPNLLYALDLTKPGAPVKWTFDPKPRSEAQGVACCDVVNRGPTYADGKIVFNALDDHVVAVDANSGKQVWKTKVGDINTGETMTMAPLVVKNLVYVGNSGGEMGVRGPAPHTLGVSRVHSAPCCSRSPSAPAAATRAITTRRSRRWWAATPTVDRC